MGWFIIGMVFGFYIGRGEENDRITHADTEKIIKKYKLDEED